MSKIISSPPSPGPGFEPEPEPELEPLLSQRQVADRLGKTRQYVWLLVESGRLKSRTVGGYRFVPESEVVRWASEPHPVGRPRGRKAATPAAT